MLSRTLFARRGRHYHRLPSRGLELEPMHRAMADSAFCTASYGAKCHGWPWLQQNKTVTARFSTQPAACEAAMAQMRQLRHWKTGHLANVASQLRDLNPSGFSRRRYLSSGGVLWTLIGANIAVFSLWQLLDQRFMEKHFTVSVGSVLHGRLHTLITNAFSQQDVGHLLSNMLLLYFFGSEIGRIFGGTFLLKCYLAGAISGALGHMFYYAYVYPWLKNIPRRYYSTQYMPSALGASGAVTAITLLHIFLYPKRIIFFQMFIPMPAALLGVIMIGQDLWSARQGGSRVSEGSHLGGAVVAVLAFISLKKPWL